MSGAWKLKLIPIDVGQFTFFNIHSMGIVNIVEHADRIGPQGLHLELIGLMSLLPPNLAIDRFFLVKVDQHDA